MVHPTGTVQGAAKATQALEGGDAGPVIRSFSGHLSHLEGLLNGGLTPP